MLCPCLLLLLLLLLLLILLSLLLLLLIIIIPFTHTCRHTHATLYVAFSLISFLLFPPYLLLSIGKSAL